MAADTRRGLFTLKDKRRLPGWLTFLLATLVRLLKWTYRIKVTDPSGLLRNDDMWPAIFVLWHNRILFLAACFPRHRRKRAAVMISASRDGEYATTFIRHFGLQVIRGSSSRRGSQALREMKKGLDDGMTAVLTLDGPRGPRYEVQPGAVLLSRACGAPVVPISLNAASRWELRSWDRTQIPKPFSRVEVRIGLPLSLSREHTGPVQREALCTLLQDALMEVTDDSTR